MELSGSFLMVIIVALCVAFVTLVAIVLFMSFSKKKKRKVKRRRVPFTGEVEHSDGDDKDKEIMADEEEGEEKEGTGPEMIGGEWVKKGKSKKLEVSYEIVEIYQYRSPDNVIECEFCGCEVCIGQSICPSCMEAQEGR